MADTREQVVIRRKVVAGFDVRAATRLPEHGEVAADRRLFFEQRHHDVRHDVPANRIFHEPWVLAPREIEANAELEPRGQHGEPCGHWISHSDRRPAEPQIKTRTDDSPG